MKMQLLGGLTAGQFLSRYWQKRPLLVRAAVPGFRAPLRAAAIRRLAGSADVEARLVSRGNRQWRLEHGPFAAARFARLPEKNWTVLVQGVNLHSAAGDALLRRFAFLPSARLDDLMVSFAAPGGGVGPHLDSYDVFLLQGEGRRRWRISSQTDHRLVGGAPLAVLSHFRPEEEWVLNPGDMLYLPPHIAHDGVALDACTTFSIGFRAPGARELAGALLDRLDQALDGRALPPRYTDAGLAATRNPGRIPEGMLDYARRVATLLRLTDARIEDALGQFLSDPKPQVCFDAPDPVLSSRAFAHALSGGGLRLDRRTNLLHRADNFYINGETLQASGSDRLLLRRLSDRRGLPAGSPISKRAHRILYHWYVYGWAHPGLES